ncbi:hypothetical protein BD413DRAFT_616610 [Trametes elegans]|nr:hypothetical protein BD413DRAFT_616610 [Trametes elegans]
MASANNPPQQFYVILTPPLSVDPAASRHAADLFYKFGITDLPGWSVPAPSTGGVASDLGVSGSAAETGDREDEVVGSSWRPTSPTQTLADPAATVSGNATAPTLPSYVTYDWVANDPRDAIFGLIMPANRMWLYNTGWRTIQNPPGSNAASTLAPGVNHTLLEYISAKTAVALTLADEPENVSITGCYIRNRNASESIRLMIHFRFAAAFAVSYNLDRTPVDGILGLGLSNVQNGFNDLPVPAAAPSFMSALKTQVIGASTGDISQRGGIVIYIVLRSPTAVGAQCWMAYNAWPTAKIPSWSAEIPVVRFESRPAEIEYFHWVLPVLSMSLVTFDEHGQMVDVPGSDFMTGVLERVVLDTGCSLSYVSEGVIQRIRDHFPCERNQLSQTGGSNDDGPLSFVVPDEQYSERLLIRFIFQGRQGKSEQALCPLDPFLCTRSPRSPAQPYREGLVFANTALPTHTSWIFGLNFFQSMFVALYKPDSPSLPYVRLAPQYRWEMNQFRLPDEAE